MMETNVRRKPFKVSTTMKAGISGAYTAGGIMNLAPIVLGSVSTGSTTVTPASMVGIRTGMTVVGSTSLTAGRTVLSVTDTTFVVSAAGTVTTGATTLTFTATDLPKFDLSSFAAPGDTVNINAIAITSSAGAASIKLAPVVMLYNTSAVQTTVSNNTAFTPSFDVQANYCQSRIFVTSAATSFVNVGASAYETMMTELDRYATVDANSCLHMVAMDANTYLYSSTETIRFTVRGTVV